jgi:hypothetical protein
LYIKEYILLRKSLHYNNSNSSTSDDSNEDDEEEIDLDKTKESIW